MYRTTSSECQKFCSDSTMQLMGNCICVKTMAYSSTPKINGFLDDYAVKSQKGIEAAMQRIPTLGINGNNSIADFLQENSPENTLALFFSVATRLLQDQRVANSVASTLLNRSDEIKLALQNINSLGNSFLSYIASAKENALKQNIHRVGSSSSGSSSSGFSSSGSSSSGNTKRADIVAVLVQAIIDIIAD